MRSPAPPALPSKRKEKAEVSQRKRANAKAKRQHYQVLVGKNAGLRAQIAAFKEKAMAMVAQAVADTKQIAAGQLAEKGLVIQGKTDELRTFEATHLGSPVLKGK